MAEEVGAGVGSDEKTEADSEEDVFHEGFGKRRGVGGLKLDEDGEAGEVAHGGEDVLRAVVSSDGARLPDVDVDDGEWGGDRPGVHEFAVATDAGVGQDAVGTGAEPGFDVGAELVPIEAQADAVERLVLLQVAG